MPGLRLNPEFIAFEGDARADRRMEFLLVIARYLQRLPDDFNQSRGFGEIEVALRGVQGGVLALGFQPLIGGIDQLFGRQRIVDGISQRDLRANSDPRRVGMVIIGGDGARSDHLGRPIPVLIRNAGRKPGQELLGRALAVGLGFFQALARDLNVKIARRRPNEAPPPDQWDRLSWSLRRPKSAQPVGPASDATVSIAANKPERIRAFISPPKC